MVLAKLYFRKSKIFIVNSFFCKLFLYENEKEIIWFHILIMSCIWLRNKKTIMIISYWSWNTVSLWPWISADLRETNPWHRENLKIVGGNFCYRSAKFVWSLFKINWRVKQSLIIKQEQIFGLFWNTKDLSKNF